MTDLFQFAEAKRRRDEGMALASQAQGPRWSEIAYAAIERVALRQIEVHIDHIILEGVPRPKSPNAWGSVWLRAIRAGIIQPSQMRRQCKTDPAKHAHSYPVYWSRLYDPRSA